MTPEQREALVERMAAAIWAATEDEPWQQVGDAGRRYCMTEARAAVSIAEEEIERRLIEEMREPTDEVRFAVWFAQYKDCGGSDAEAEELAREKVASADQRKLDCVAMSAFADAFQSSRGG